jgi:decaprenyl-phosphate phosphoribosyltransferase
VVTSLYSSVLKHIAVVDLVAVASGFVLRAIAGAVATDVEMSTWFLLTTSFASLFIVAGKRYAELREVGDMTQTRATLDDYSLGFLRIVLSVSCGAALVTYCIWAFDTKEIAGTSWPFYELSIVPMVTALLRYTLILEQGHGGAPEEIFVADRTLQVLGIIWVLVFGLGVYVS